jgi:hypothetical protein
LGIEEVGDLSMRGLLAVQEQNCYHDDNANINKLIARTIIIIIIVIIIVFDCCCNCF